MNLGGGKPVNQGEEKKYATPLLLNKPKEVEYDRLITNLSVDLIKEIQTHVFEQGQKGIKMRDEKTGRLKKINVSMWARKVFTEALEEERKNREG